MTIFQDQSFTYMAKLGQIDSYKWNPQSYKCQDVSVLAFKKENNN